MCSLTLLLFAFVSLSLIETTDFQENGSVMLGVFFWLRASSAIDPSSLNGLPKESLICSYLLAGFPYKDILQFLLTYHNIELTMRHLHCILRKQKLFRKKKLYHREKY